MRVRNSIGAMALVAVLLTTVGSAAAYDESKYPDFNGQWRRAGSVRGDLRGAGFDPSRPFGREQRPPLTPQYQTIYEANLEDMAKGGQRITGVTAFDTRTSEQKKFVGRLYVDCTGHGTIGTLAGADYDMEPKGRKGYSIGTWLDTDGDGKYDELRVETRGMRGPRSFEASGIPLHADNETVVQERIYLDKADPNLMHDDITTIDHALTRPWVVNQTYRRVVSDKPLWFPHEVCGEGNNHVGIGKENYFLSSDGYLMPTKKDQPPPDLRYFKQ